MSMTGRAKQPRAKPTILRDLVPKRIEGGSSFENLYPTSHHQASVPVIPALRAAFRISRDLRQQLRHVRKGLRHVRKGMSGPQGAVNPIASPARVASISSPSRRHQPRARVASISSPSRRHQPRPYLSSLGQECQ
jgi:hypothetical protein